jgi:hypothetical protein
MREGNHLRRFGFLSVKTPVVARTPLPCPARFGTGGARQGRYAGFAKSFAWTGKARFWQNAGGKRHPGCNLPPRGV